MLSPNQEKFVSRLTEITKASDSELCAVNDTISFDISTDNMHAEFFNLVAELHFKIVHMFPINQYNNTTHALSVHQYTN
ncbi:hypothetical protein ACLBQC_31050, partial [Klebsiella pneumoniae]|uniref:hypothetical protein n=1 Tax=Klebsiella pneumoniae TaxID=573 RepID=UPI003968FDD3